VVTVRLYVEGGGDSKRLKTQCRRGFRKFIEKAGLQGRMPRIVACGGRQRAYDSFATALAAGTSTPMLLVDAERRVTDASAWEHLPREVVVEAIVNAVVHRDYTDSSSVQVMLFADRLEVMNSGGLPPALTVEKLRVAHQSVPRNPLAPIDQSRSSSVMDTIRHPILYERSGSAVVSSEERSSRFAARSMSRPTRFPRASISTFTPSTTSLVSTPGSWLSSM